VRKSATTSTPAVSVAPVGPTTVLVIALTAAPCHGHPVCEDRTGRRNLDQYTLVVNDPLPVTTVNFVIPGATSGQITLSCPALMYWIAIGAAVDFTLHVPQCAVGNSAGLQTACCPPGWFRKSRTKAPEPRYREDRPGSGNHAPNHRTRLCRDHRSLPFQVAAFEWY